MMRQGTILMMTNDMLRFKTLHAHVEATLMFVLFWWPEPKSPRGKLLAQQPKHFCAENKLWMSDALIRIQSEYLLIHHLLLVWNIRFCCFTLSERINIRG
jgi:hypothetical protein